MAILIILFIGLTVYLFYHVIAANKLFIRGIAHNNLNKATWKKIGAHFLFGLLGIVVFSLFTVLVYYIAYWRHL